MGRRSVPFIVLLMALALASCARRGELPASANPSLAENDDTFCRAGGTVAPGSPQYVACVRDRDSQRANAIDRADKKQRDLGQYMLDNPVHP